MSPQRPNEEMIMTDITLQHSHDELAKGLVAIVDQIVRGSHAPTPAQLLEAATALREAAPFIRENAWGVNPKYALQLADIIQEKFGVDAWVAPGPR
jgi:hypothetical protein